MGGGEFIGNRITNTCAAHYKVTLDAQSKAVFFNTIDEHKAKKLVLTNDGDGKRT